MIAAGLRYDVDLEWDQFAVDCQPLHLDPGERGVSSGRALLGGFAHLVDEDLVEDYQAKGKEALMENVEEALPRDKPADEQLSRTTITHCFRYCSALVLGRSKQNRVGSSRTPGPFLPSISPPLTPLVSFQSVPKPA